MKSTNFEILRNNWPELASLAGFAENYVDPDPTSCLVKLRAFVEQMVHHIYDANGFSEPYQASLNDLLTEAVFKQAVNKSTVIDKFHIIKNAGNKAAHGSILSQDSARFHLQGAFDLTCWFFITYGAGRLQDLPKFKEPVLETKGKIKKEKKAALQKIKEQENKMAELLKQLEAERLKNKTQEKSAEDRAKLTKEGQKAADLLEFNEATTRMQLIDSMLADAGWDVGVDGQDTDEVGQEVEVQDQPTESGKGYIDYVLWDDNGKPLAVVEAKRTAESATVGRTQAKCYADGLEKEHGQRPVIFYTNGYDVFIWDDAGNYPDRKVYGYYSKESLQYLVNFQRKEKQLLEHIDINPTITDRDYQQEAIRRTTEKFSKKYRKSLLIQATGTGKTRVAISLTDVLIKANWVKRVLFLCDRKELRKQAKNAFGEHLKDASCTIVTQKTHKERQHRIYLATYPAMIKLFQTFDVGFFDLIIADESHRSIYNRYRELFLYFDSLQVGLTATPVNFIGRNTYRLFGCDDKDPTYYYSLEQGVEAGYLSPYEVSTHTTNFLRKGIKYEELTDEQKQQLEDDGENPEDFGYENMQVDSAVFNKETDRSIIRHLMDNGIREASGQHLGKTIIFARRHDHAVLLKNVFDEMYPQYGGSFCQVIDNHDPRAEQLIDDFKSTDGKDEITIAISVDMLDTGIDVPEIVNLTFAKPIRSQVKFDQMIGRGTRLSLNLFGPGKDKLKFRIFEHFSKKPKQVDPSIKKSLLQLLFEARINIARTAFKEQNSPIFATTITEIGKMIKTLPEKTIAVMDSWEKVFRLQKTATLQTFTQAIINELIDDIGPLMQWININKQTDAYRLDLLMIQLEDTWLKKNSIFDDKKAELRSGTAMLPINLNQVMAKEQTVTNVKSDEFWQDVSFAELEKVRLDLREIWQYRQGVTPPPRSSKIIDITDGGVETNEISTGYETVDMMAYRLRVEEELNAHFATNPTLQKIRQGQPVTPTDLNTLTSLILTQNPDVDLDVLHSFYADTAVSLEYILRTIIGIDEVAVELHFKEFRTAHNLNANQLRFMALLKAHIAKYGSIDIDKLYEPPFTGIDSNGVDGIFPNEKDVDELVDILGAFTAGQTTT